MVDGWSRRDVETQRFASVYEVAGNAMFISVFKGFLLRRSAPWILNFRMQDICKRFRWFSAGRENVKKRKGNNVFCDSGGPFGTPGNPESPRALVWQLIPGGIAKFFLSSLRLKKAFCKMAKGIC